jgi:hypothetical protein
MYSIKNFSYIASPPAIYTWQCGQSSVILPATVKLDMSLRLFNGIRVYVDAAGE